MIAKNNRSSKKNPCPICFDTKGKCQISHDEDFIMCMDTHSEVNGYRFLGVNKSGVWGMHLRSDKRISEQERLERKIIKQRADQERLETLKREALPVADRDKAFRAIANELGLSRADKKRLLDRGLTDEQIDQLPFFSVRGKTQINNSIPSNLSGVSIDRSGNKYLYSDDGYFCPSLDFEGRVNGGQYRSNLTNSGNKYKWLKGIKSSHLPNGELPITFVRGNNSEPVNQWLKDLGIDEDLKVICPLEGLLKPYIASCRHGVDTIGAAGFNFNSGKEQVREIITKGGYNAVILPLDGGAITNPMVMSQLEKNVKIFEDLGCKIFIGWWNQYEKSDQDFDEIDGLEGIELKDYGTIKAMSKPLIFRKWKRDELGKLKGFKADKTIDKKRFYDDGKVSDDEIDFILDNNQSIIMNGGKKTGKSYVMQHKIKKWKKEEKRIINIGCRRVLNESQAIQWDITYIGDAENERYSLATIYERDGGLSLVVDSFLKTKHLDWTGAHITIDECEQWINHLLTANTSVKDHRGYILKELEDKFKFALATGGKIIGLDADSSDIFSDWLEGITGIKPFKLQNTAKSHNNNCYVFNGDKEGYDDLIQSLFNDLENKERIFLASDNRKELEAIEVEVRKAFPSLNSVLLTSNTINEKEIRDFIKNPNKAIKDSHVMLLSVSPVMQSGVSIDIKGYFTKVYAICTGIIEPSTMRQLLIRVRDDCDRYLWIADKAKGNYSNDFDWRKIIGNRDTFINSLPQIAQYVTALNENLTNGELLDKIKSLLDSHDNLTDIHSITKAKLTARRNLALSDYRAVLIDELEKEGYNIIHFGNPSIPTSFDVDIPTTKKDLDMDKAIAVSGARNISKFEFDNLKNKSYPTKDEQNKMLKYSIKDNFPLVLIDPIFVLTYILKDNWQLLRAVKRYWFTQNKEVAQKLDIKSIHYQNKVALSGGKLWLEDIKPNSHYIALFERLGLSEFIDNGLVVNKHSESLKAFFERCKDYRKVDGISNRELLRSCGVKFTNTIELINLLRKVVQLYGFKLECVSKVKDEGSTIRNYLIVRAVNDELWQQLFDSFNFKYQELKPINFDLDLENHHDFDEDIWENVSFEVRTAESLDVQGLGNGSLLPDFYNKIAGSDPDSNPYVVSDSGVFAENPSNLDLLNLNQGKIAEPNKLFIFPSLKLTDLLLYWHEKPLPEIEGNPKFMGYCGATDFYKLKYSNGDILRVHRSQVKVKI